MSSTRDIGSTIRSVLSQRGITLDDLSHADQERVANAADLSLPELHRAVSGDPRHDPPYSPSHRAKVLFDEADRLLAESEAEKAEYRQAVSRGEQARATELRRQCLRTVEHAAELEGRAETYARSTEGANLSYDPATGATTYDLQGASKRARKKMKRARNALLEQAQRRMARGERQAAARSLDGAERLHRAIKANRAQGRAADV